MATGFLGSVVRRVFSQEALVKVVWVDVVVLVYLPYERLAETYGITLSGDALTNADQLFPPFRLFPG